MDQIKTGSFIKALRKSHQMTQEQMAEVFGVSRRTVSRWETGSNLPDLDILVEMADYFKVDLRELLNGEPKAETMDSAFQDTIWKVAEYSKEQRNALKKRIHRLFIAGFVASLFYMVLPFCGCEGSFLGGLCLGMTSGMMIVGILMTSRHAVTIQNAKRKLFQKLKWNKSRANKK